MNGRFNRLVCFVCALYCCFFTVQVSASGAFIKTKYGYAKKLNGDQFRIDYLIETGNIPPGSTIPRNKQLSVIYSKASVVEKAKKFRRVNPLSVAVSSAVAGAGYAIDELTGQITRPVQVPADESQTSDFGWQSGSFPTFETPQQSCQDRFPGQSTGSGYCSAYAGPDEVVPSGHCREWKVPRGSNGYCTTYKRPSPGLNQDPTTVTEYIPVSSSDENQVIEKAVGRASERQLKPIFSDPYSNPYNWQPFLDAVRGWMRDVADRDPNDNVTYDPVNNRWVIGSPSGGPDIEVSPDPLADPSVSHFDPTESSGTVPEGQVNLPDFCTWAIVLCEWLEWTREMPEEMEPDEFPVEQLTVADIRKDYDSGLGGGSCPSPVITSFMGSQIVFSYETACYGARTYFKPVLLMIAGIISAFIIVGASRRA